MSFFVQDDLVPNSIITSPVGNNPQSQFWLSLFNFSTPSMEFILFRFQVFLVAWCIFYSAIGILQFLDYRVLRPTGNQDDDHTAIQGLKYALYIWWSWVLVWVFYVLSDLNRGSNTGFVLGLFTICLGFIKMYLDLKWILEMTTGLPWSKKFANYLRSVLRLQ